MRPQSEEVVAIKKIRLGKVKEVRGGTREHGQGRHRGTRRRGCSALCAAAQRTVARCAARCTRAELVARLLRRAAPQRLAALAGARLPCAPKQRLTPLRAAARAARAAARRA
jgi:hypothetical protein